MEHEPAVELTGVTKLFNAGRPDQVTALTGVDLTVRRGEFVSLIGPSGCGKSTLLRLVADLIPVSAGSVRVAGKSARAARLDQEYGIAFQQAGLFEWRTVLRNVELPLELRGVGRRERRARAREMLELVALTDFAGHYPAQLSGGMQQRVAIARALAVHPRLLLMDEPFGALDEMTRERLQDELLEICARTGTSMIFVTHSIPEAVYLSDRVVVLSARPGRITDVIDIELAERTEATRQAAGFFAGITRVRRALRGGPASGPDPDAAGPPIGDTAAGPPAGDAAAGPPAGTAVSR
jgi:NitT/TauT family transport system ATP-binding protein